MREVLALAGGPRTALAVVLGALTVLSGAALLATSGALITGAAQRPSTLLVLLPLITGVRLFGVARAALRYAERLVTHDVTLRVVARVRGRLLERLTPLAPAALTGVRGGELLSRVRTDVDELQGVVARLLVPAGVAVLAGGTAVGLTALVSPATAAVLAVLLLVLGEPSRPPRPARDGGRRSPRRWPTPPSRPTRSTWSVAWPTTSAATAGPRPCARWTTPSSARRRPSGPRRGAPR
jgi:ABC-type multidrug transport system fused ATPase/permease subunit